MKKNRFILNVFVATLSIFLFIGQYSYANETEIDLTAKYAILMDYETGQVLYSKNGYDKLYPASTTKIWTAFMVIKYATDIDEIIEVQDLPPIEGSSMYLKNGESFTVRQLLESLLVHSSNDAAYVLAKHISGSETKFVEMMNEEARKIGAKNTNFTQSHGLPDEKHYTTAYDMALMTREAMSNEIFRNMVKIKSISFEATEVNPYKRTFINSNKFLTSSEIINYRGKDIPIKYDIVDGIKTGYTDLAGRCLLSSGVKNNQRIISAVFKSDGNNVYLDSRTLLDYGFENFHTKTIVNKEVYADSIKVLFSKQGELEYEPVSDYKVVIPNGSKEHNYSINVKVDSVKLPVKKGDVVGRLQVYNENELEQTIDLVAKDNVNSIFEFITENGPISFVLKFIVSISIIVALIVMTIKIRRK